VGVRWVCHCPDLLLTWGAAPQMIAASGVAKTFGTALLSAVNTVASRCGTSSQGHDASCNTWPHSNSYKRDAHNSPPVPPTVSQPFPMLQLRAKRFPGITHADLFSFVGSIGPELAGGPPIAWYGMPSATVQCWLYKVAWCAGQATLTIARPLTAMQDGCFKGWPRDSSSFKLSFHQQAVHMQHVHVAITKVQAQDQVTGTVLKFMGP